MMRLYGLFLSGLIQFNSLDLYSWIYIYIYIWITRYRIRIYASLSNTRVRQMFSAIESFKAEIQRRWSHSVRVRPLQTCQGASLLYNINSFTQFLSSVWLSERCGAGCWCGETGFVQLSSRASIRLDTRRTGQQLNLLGRRLPRYIAIIL